MKYIITSFQFPLSEKIEAESLDEAMTLLLSYHPIAKESKKCVVIVEWKKGHTQWKSKQLFLANGKIIDFDYRENAEAKRKELLEIEANNDNAVMMDKEKAIKAIKTGAVVACFSGIFSFAIALYALQSNATGLLGYWNDPWILIDVILVFLLAFWTYKKSRTAAILLFIYYIFTRIHIAIELGNMPGVVSILLLYIYGKTIHGTFVFHRIEKQENPNYKPASKLSTCVSIVFAGIFLFLVAFAMEAMTGITNHVQTGDEISEDYMETLISEDIVNQKDTIQYFYSYGNYSILEGGSVLTNNRVVMYYVDDNNEVQVLNINFEDITSVELSDINFEDIITGSSVYKVSGKTYKVYGDFVDAYVMILLPMENGGERKFIEALRAELTLQN